jgi:hypothetical protein
MIVLIECISRQIKVTSNNDTRWKHEIKTKHIHRIHYKHEAILLVMYTIFDVNKYILLEQTELQ